MEISNSDPIGVFDSGVGGLTVYRALREALPQENFLYLGDTARLPYGTKSVEIVVNYTQQAALKLMERKIKLLVVACNTASALALPQVRHWQPKLPCLGVVEPGVAGAVTASKNGRILVLATEGTVRSGAYQEAILRRRPEAQVEGLACNVMVSLAEEGWTDGPEARAVFSRYLSKVKMTDYDTVILGCTHFPLMENVIQGLLPSGVSVIDSAKTTAESVANYLRGKGMEKEGGKPGSETFLVTDGLPRFRALAERFLGGKSIKDVELISF